MKKRVLIILVSILVLGAIPFSKKVYEDGGTKKYTALWYSYIDWNKMVSEAENAEYNFVKSYYTENEFVFFPHNFKHIDAYWNDEKLNDIPKIKKTSDNTQEKKEIRYSNLVDVETKALVKKLLEEYDIPTENIDNYFYYVDYFNDAVQNKGLVKSEFSTYPNKDPYHNIRYGEDLEKKNLDFMGTNCRLSSFFLLKDSIKVKDNNDYTGDVLIFDNSSLENLPKESITPAEKKKFFTIFAGIPSPLVKDKAVHIKNIQEYWAKHGVSFPEKKGLSTLEVFTYDDLEQALFIGHIGVLLQYNDEYIFLEKLSFDLPYQAVIFQTKKQIYDYLIEKYGKYTSEQAPEVFIMENDQEFKTE